MSEPVKRSRSDGPASIEAESGAKRMKSEGEAASVVAGAAAAPNAEVSSKSVDPSTAPGRLANYGNPNGKLCVQGAGKYSNKKDWVKLLKSNGVAFRNVQKQRGNTFAMVSFNSDTEREAGRAQLSTMQYKGKQLVVADAKAKQVKKRERTWGTDRNGAQVVGKERTIQDAVTPLAKQAYAVQLETKREAMQKSLVRVTEGMHKTIAEWVLRGKGGGGRRIGKKQIAKADITNHAPQWLIAKVKRSAYAPPVVGSEPVKHIPYGERMVCCPLVDSVVPSPFTDGYRTKCTFTVGKDSGGELCVGFRLSSFADGITLARADGCRNVPLGVVKVAADFEAHARATGLPALIATGHAGDGGADAERQGVWRRLTVRACLHTGQMMLIVETTSLSVTASGEVALRLGAGDARGQALRADLVAWFHSLRATAGLRPTALILTQFNGCSVPDANHPHEVLVGSTVCEQILGVPFEISPGAFFQANSRGAEVLYSIVAEWVDAGAERRDSVLLDICCGTGTIGLCLLAALRERRGAHSKARASVLGVDMCESAIVDAKRNAVRSGFGDAARFYAGKAEDVLPSLLADAFPNGAPVAALGSHNANARGSSAADTSSAVGPGAAQTAAGTAAVGARCHGARAVAFGGSYRMLVQRVAHSGFATTVTPPPDFGEREFERAQARDAAGSAAHCFGIVDPPRSGLHPNVIRAIRNCGAIKRLVYVSCNPTGSFVRDAVELCRPGKMSKKDKLRGRPFRPVKSTAVDMFPHTEHCELVTLFERM